MLDKYQETMIMAVETFGDTEKYVELLLFRTSPGGVAGMSSTWSLALESSLGLLIRLVVHVCASTIAKGQNGNKKFEVCDESAALYLSNSVGIGERGRDREWQLGSDLNE